MGYAKDLKVAIMQPYIFPYIGYFQLIRSVDIFVVFDNVNFIKKGWIHRNRLIYQQNEKNFSLSLKQATQNKLINELEVFEWGQQRTQLINLIKDAYRGAPYYNSALEVVEEALLSQEFSLARINQNAMQVVCRYLDLKTTFITASDIFTFTEEKGEEKVLCILEKLSATQYINAPNGKSLYHVENFKRRGIELLFLKMPKLVRYKQRSIEFVPFLSIIDLLMNLDKVEIRKMIDDYEIEVFSD